MRLRAATRFPANFNGIGRFKMIGMRKFVGFLMALAFAAFALPASADGGDEKFTLVMAPANVSGGPQSITAALATQVGDDDRIRSFKLITPPGVTQLSVTSTSPAISPQNIQIVQATATAAGSVSVKNVNLGRSNRTIVLTLGVTYPPAGCAPAIYTWNAKAWEDSYYSSGPFAGPATGSQLKTTVAGGVCTYSLSGMPTSVTAGTTTNPAATVMLTNTGNGGSISNFVLTPPVSLTGMTVALVSPPAGVTILNNVITVAGPLAAGANVSFGLTLTAAKSCAGIGSANWTVASGAFTGNTPATGITAPTPACSMSFDPLPTSVAKYDSNNSAKTTYTQIVNLTSGPGDAQVMLEATGPTCPAFAPITKGATPNATGGSVTFTGLTFTSTGSCTFKATDVTPQGYPLATKAFDIFAASGLACDLHTYVSSVVDTSGALDPDSQLQPEFFTSTDVNWGLKRGENVGGSNCADAPPVNYTLTISEDKKLSSLAYDKSGGQGFASFKYVLVWPGTNAPADGWPNYRPDVSWVSVGNLPAFAPGLPCLSDDLADGLNVMPLIPNAAPFNNAPATLEPAYQYDSSNVTKTVKMCIAQVGWTGQNGKIFYWTKVIDQGDGFVKGPSGSN
jgi:hypothetical protein